ncbi:hypothetical protein [uncultured Psychrosphaera sp.]|uniref:hypothetical protein n=1 Tax=uncultured Psychrosphaera sp. TaxID=1403522 RepID=UPI002637F4F7|nr:hypothetical protein [uncultured Psychrosphaera sp.]
MKIFTKLFVLSSLALTGCFGDSNDNSNELTVGVSTFAFNDLDTDSPVMVNHSIPVTFSIFVTTSQSEVITVDVPVSFRFQETNPTDPDDPRLCDSTAIVVEVETNGVPVEVVDNIWPVSECEEMGEEGTEVTLVAIFYDEEEEIESTTNIELPTLTLASGGVDIVYGLSSEDSVALLPFVAEENGEKLILSVSSSLLYNGVDPYFSLIDESEIPDDLYDDLDSDSDMSVDDLTFDLTDEELEALGDLPGTATLSYSLIPNNDSTVELELTFDPEGDGNITNTLSLTNLDVGTPNSIYHDLYLEGDALSAVTDGDYATETSFTVRGCISTDFSQDGNNDADANDCSDIDVVMVRESEPETGATEISFNREKSLSAGNSKIKLVNTITTENSLSRNGAFSFNEADVSLAGKIGRNYSVSIGNAYAEAEVTTQLAFYDTQVSVFDEVLFSESDEEELGFLGLEEEFSVEKEQEVASLAYGFGPIKLGFIISVGGRVGLTIEDALELISNEDDCQEVLETESTIILCGSIGRTVTPGYSMTANIYGGFKGRNLRAGVDAEFTVLETNYPLTARLAFGTTLDLDDGVGSEFLVVGNVNWTAETTLISGQVKLVGSVRIFGRRRGKSVTVFSFSSKTYDVTLLNKSIGTAISLL